VLGPSPLPTSPPPTIVRIDSSPGWGPRNSKLSPVCPTLIRIAAVGNPTLAHAGFLTVATSVRHSGQAVCPAQLHDVQAALRWLRHNPLGLLGAPDRIGMQEHSAGVRLAAMASLNPRPGTPRVRRTPMARMEHRHALHCRAVVARRP